MRSTRPVSPFLMQPVPEIQRAFRAVLASVVVFGASIVAAQAGATESPGAKPAESARRPPGALTSVSVEEAAGHAVMAVLIEQIARCNDGPMPEGFHRAFSRAGLIESRPYDINAKQFSYALRTPMTVGKGLKVTHVMLLGHEQSGYSFVGLTLPMSVAAAEAALKASGWPVRGDVRAKKPNGETLVRERALVPAINLKGSTNWICGFNGN